MNQIDEKVGEDNGPKCSGPFEKQHGANAKNEDPDHVCDPRPPMIRRKNECGEANHWRISPSSEDLAGATSKDDLLLAGDQGKPSRKIKKTQTAMQ